MARLRSAKAGPGAAGGQDALEAFAGLGQLSRQQWLAAMHFRADVGCDQADDAFAVRFGQLHAHWRAPL